MKQFASKSRMKILMLALIAGVCGTSSLAHAEACTYREAMMALERGNVDRGMALMRMASRDGDLRAATFLRGQDYAQVVESGEAVVAEAQSEMTGEQVDLK